MENEKENAEKQEKDPKLVKIEKYHFDTLEFSVMVIIFFQSPLFKEEDADLQYSASTEDISLDVCLEYDDGNVREDEEAIHQRIEDLCQRIEEKQKIVKLKREELRKYEQNKKLPVLQILLFESKNLE